MKKIINSLIVFIILINFALISYATQSSELEDKKDNIQKQIDDSKNELKEVDNELSENLKQLQKIDESIQESEQTLQQLSEKISKLEEEIKENEEEVEKLTKKYNEQKELLDERIITMYETDDSTYLSVIFDSKSISDVISNYYLISELASYDMDLLEIVEKERNEIEQKNNEIKHRKEELEQDKINEQKTKIALSNTRTIRQNYISKLNDEEKNIQNKIDEYNKEIESIEAEIRALARKTANSNTKVTYSGGLMIWPIPGYTTITSYYGMRVHPITGVYKLHSGVDVGAPTGAKFVAMADGTVVKAAYTTGYGNMVIIDHGGGIQTLYAHGSAIIASQGQKVSAGDPVLKVGSTGYSTGPHAHFEVRVNGNTVNPLNYVSAP